MLTGSLRQSPGDLARVEENVSAAPRKGTKKEAVTEGVEGVVYKVRKDLPNGRLYGFLFA